MGRVGVYSEKNMFPFTLSLITHLFSVGLCPHSNSFKAIPLNITEWGRKLNERVGIKAGKGGEGKIDHKVLRILRKDWGVLRLGWGVKTGENVLKV